MDCLEKLNDKNYIKNLDEKTVNVVSSEIRKFLIENVLNTGGHLASNLGIVELVLAIHKVFDFPEDKIIFDVGHQCYVHKILSGRYKEFSSLRQIGGISGFPKTSESEYDSFNTGHSSTSISAALGMARARDLKGEKHNIIAFIGDGALGGGMAFEALNDLGASDSKIIIILNDNEMSINENIGGLSSHLSMLRLTKGYLNAKSGMHKVFDKLGVVGKILTKIVQKIKRIIRVVTLRKPMFEELGISYIGLINGYDFNELTDALKMAKNAPGSVIIHTITKKGKGYYDAEVNPTKYHGVSPLNTSLKNNIQQSYTDVFGEYMLNKAKQNDKLVSITAAMSTNCGLNEFSLGYPKRFFDVGIAEEHAVTMAAGLARGGMVPVFSVYSTFLQRAYDQILHDVCLQNLHVIFAIDRAGIVGEDGETHQGIFDFSYLLHLPNITVLSPSCKEEFIKMLDYAVDELEGPVAIRFPKDNAYSRSNMNFKFSIPEVVNSDNNDEFDITLISVGRMYYTCEKSVDILKNLGYKVCLINLGTIKPLNNLFINDILSKTKMAFTVEDNITSCGAGEYFSSCVNTKYKSKIVNIGFENKFVEQGSQNELFEIYGLTAEKIANRIKEELEKNE